MAQKFECKSSPGPYTLPPLRYEYHELEPYISGEIMKRHYEGHHCTYVKKLNEAIANYAKLTPPTDLLERIRIQGDIDFNGGGHVNHSLFWENLTPPLYDRQGNIIKKGNRGGVLKKGSKLEEAINAAFGSVKDFKDEFNATTVAIHGSGWGWLGYNVKRRTLDIVTTHDQDPLQSHVPIIGVDVWEHAYYPQEEYKNNRGEYLKQIWNVIDFDEGDARLLKATGGKGLPVPGYGPN